MDRFNLKENSFVFCGNSYYRYLLIVTCTCHQEWHVIYIPKLTMSRGRLK